MIKNVSFGAIVAGRFKRLIGHKLNKEEWSRIILMTRKYSRAAINDVLDAFEKDEVGVQLTTIGMFEYVVAKLHRNEFDGDFKTLLAQRDSLLKDQEKGKQMLENLTGRKIE